MDGGGSANRGAVRGEDDGVLEGGGAISFSEAQIQELLTRLYDANLTSKTLDETPRWEKVRDRQSVKLEYRAALRMDGNLGGGVSVRLQTPENGWEDDLYGQIEIRRPGMRSALRLNPVEWRPLREHRNPPDAPEPYRLKILRDRWHPFELNQPLGIDVFTQSKPGIAAPLPRAVSSFSDYIDLCAELWRLPELREIPAPPWSKQLF